MGLSQPSLPHQPHKSIIGSCPIGRGDRYLSVHLLLTPTSKHKLSYRLGELPREHNGKAPSVSTDSVLSYSFVHLLCCFLRIRSYSPR
jgi:hypothetical protein